MQLVSSKTETHFKKLLCFIGPTQFTTDALSYLMPQIPRAEPLELSNHTNWHTNTHNHIPPAQNKR